MNWIATEIGEYPFASVSNNQEIVNNTTVKAIKDFDFDLKDTTKENITPAVKDKYNLKQQAFCTAHNAYATIIKYNESDNTYLCKLRQNQDSDQQQTTEVTVKA